MTTLTIDGAPVAVVPVEPTEAMKTAGRKALLGRGYPHTIAAADPALTAAVVEMREAAANVAAWKEAIQTIAPELGGALRAIYVLEAALARVEVSR